MAQNQNDILDITNTFKPLVSSNVQSGSESSENGRPSSTEGKETSESTVANKVAGTNANA